MPWMAGQSRFGAMSPLGGIGGMNPQQQQPNPAAQITPPQPGLATPQGIQQLAQKAAGTARPNAFELLHDVLYGRVKDAETSATGGNPESGGSSGGGNAGTGAGGGQGFGVHSIGGALGAGTAGQNAGAQQANAPGAQMAGNNGIGGGPQAGGLLQRPAMGAQGGVGAFGIVRPGLPSPGPLGGGNSMGPGPKLAGLYTKYAMGMMTPGPGGLQPQPGLTANQPPPPGPAGAGQVPAGPGQPQPGGGAPTAAGGQPQPGAQPGAPPAQPGQAPMTPPMAEPLPQALPANPRPPMPPMPMRPEVMAQTLAHVHQPTQMAPPRPARLAEVRERPLDNFAAPTRHRLPLGPFHPTSVVQGCSTLFFRLVRPRRRLRLLRFRNVGAHFEEVAHLDRRRRVVALVPRRLFDHGLARPSMFSK